MGIEAMLWARDKRVKNVSIKCLLLLLADYSHPETHEAFPTLQTLADQTHLSIASVQRGLKWLEDNGFLIKTHRRNGQRNLSNSYILNLKPRSSPAHPEQLKIDAVTCSNGALSPAQALSSKQKEDLGSPKGLPISKTAPSSGGGAPFKPEVKATKLPDPWFPPQERFDLAVKVYAGNDAMDIDYETRQFISRARSKKWTSFNWDETWAEYIRRSERNYKRWNKEDKPAWAKLTEEEFCKLGPAEAQAAVESGRFVLPFDQ